MTALLQATPPVAAPFHPPPAVMPVAQRPPQVFVRGQGSWLWDAQDRRYFDAVQGWAVNTLGHAPPAVAEALAHQAGTLLQAGPGFYNAPAIALCERLCALSGLAHAFITTSGAEANEGAVKLARKWGQQQRGGAATVITMANSFHGRTLAMMAASGKPGFDRIFAPAVPGFVHMPFNDLAAVRQAIGTDTVAVMLELVQGEAGVVEAQPGFVQGLRALCDAHGLLLIVDEVQTGIGRCGTLFAHTQWDVQPDIVTLGKGLGAGVPAGAVLARAGVCRFVPGDQGGTYNGNALVCAAALAVLDAVSAPGFMQNVHNRGEQLAAGLARLSARHGLGGVHGRGLLRALALPPQLASGVVADAARTLPGDCGLLVNPAQPQRLRLMPALNITAAEVDTLLALLDRALAIATAPPA
ncbi:aminotransferase class III-fold pyridoxal phosphate-dependent enzyme [Ideonella sp. DXS22W]|uniref:Aminotransferase class III-fold pyridoxal phosphate-dependent enzyme n=1 Tax=Pseudaquabacterium inlustre TaxID=2984192 RepID=A0ABU9CAY1_9BURK